MMRQTCRAVLLMGLMWGLTAAADSDIITFTKGALIIPEQGSFQTGCGAVSAYGLIWKILQSNQTGGYNANHPVTVYWGINSGKVSPNRCVPTNKSTPPSPNSGVWSDASWNDGCDVTVHNTAQQPVVPVPYHTAIPTSGLFPNATVPMYGTTSALERPAFVTQSLTNTSGFTDIQYMGGPFVISATDAANVIDFLRGSTSTDEIGRAHV